MFFAMILSDFGETSCRALAGADSAPSYIRRTAAPTTAGILRRGRAYFSQSGGDARQIAADGA
ncbi:hypothetical protein EAO28_06570 [Klebsiella pneumoniae]|uniref:Uncharacterized protein n=1 Tax=Klebsiella pneumoniae TaxID=573 RepID=A0A3P2EG02_KLEPN|nr:hypothetical protein EAO28_06570 [Klebsiella pneumoniae]